MTTDKIKKYVVTFAVGLAFAIIFWTVNDLIKSSNYSALFSSLSDGLFVPGVLIAGVGGLIGTYNEGLFDGLSYGMHGLFGFRSLRRDSTPKKENYGEYKERKHKNKRPIGHLITVGLSFIFTAVVCLMISTVFD